MTRDTPILVLNGFRAQFIRNYTQSPAFRKIQSFLGLKVAQIVSLLVAA